MSEDAGGKKTPLYYLRNVLVLVAGIFHIYTATFGIWVNQKPIHLGLFLLIVFCNEMDKALQAKKYIPFTLYTLCFIASGITGIYLSLYYNVLTNRLGQANFGDMFVGIVIIILVMVFTYKSLGLVLPLVAGIFMLYARFGTYFPGLLKHRGFGFSRLVTYLPFTSDGIMGYALAASAKFVVLYLIFAATLEVCGGGQFFIDLANSLMGDKRGGPAKTAVISSALMGSISGSAIANVVGTGAFTIPLMKKSGYRPEFAAAVEASASTGGQITPPVMASSAFIMAEMLGISYGVIIVAAILPALLYYFSIFTNVDMEATKRNLVGLPKESLPKLWPLLKHSGYLLLPIVLLVYTMGVLMLSPQRAGIYAIFCSIVLSWFRKDTRVGPKKLFAIIKSGINSSMAVVSACACSGIIVGVVTGTGVGALLSRLIVQLSMGQLGLALLFTMLATIVLGMGMPTIPAYLIPAVMLVPVLTKMGAAPLGAHLFILFFASMSGLTPPVALTSYAAAGLADSNLWKTSIIAFQIALAGFTMPYVFIFQPGLLLNDSPVNIIHSFVVCTIGLYALAACCRGIMFSKLNIPERIVCFASGVLLIETHIITDLIGVALLIIIGFISFWKSKRMASSP
jgi:TRAP transporter 4TM/12TM fusion protein